MAVSDFNGPWVVDAASDDQNVVGVADASGKPICDIWHGVDGWTATSGCTSKEWKLDRAKLIAAAPEMLEALVDCRRTLEIANFTQELSVVDAAIAKAIGEFA